MSVNQAVLKELQLQDIACPACQQRDAVTLTAVDRHKLGLHTVLCQHCGLVYYNPMPTADSLVTFYRDNYRALYRNKSDVSAQDLSQLGVFERIEYTVDFLLEHFPERSTRVLDFGCGDGTLLKALAKRGYTQLSGIEPSIDYRDFASDEQLTLYPDLSNVPAGNQYDLIILNHVFEHIPNPLDRLQNFSALLDDNGKLYIDVPDLMAYRDIDDLHVAHVLHFTEQSKRNMFAAASMRVDLLQAHQPPHHPRSIRSLVAAAGTDQNGIVPVSESYKSAIMDKIAAITANESWYRLKQAISPFISIGKIKRRLQGRAH